MQRDGRRQQPFDIAPAPAVAAHRDRRFATRQQHARRGHRLATLCHLQCNTGQHLADVARFAFQRVAQDVRAVAGLTRHAGGGFQRHLRRGNHAHLGALQPGVTRLDGFPAAALQHRQNFSWHVNAVAPDHGQRVVAGAGIGHGRAGGNVHGVVARHVGNQQRQHPCRMAGRGQTATLDGRQMTAHAVHLADRGARFKQRAAHSLLVLQRQTRQRQGQQR